MQAYAGQQRVAGGRQGRIKARGRAEHPRHQLHAIAGAALQEQRVLSHTPCIDVQMGVGKRLSALGDHSHSRIVHGKVG